jgi:peptide deformylase
LSRDKFNKKDTNHPKTTMLEIITYPNPILKEKCKPVSNPTSLEIKQFIADMTQSLRAHEHGLAIAAPQVGKALRIFVIEIDDNLITFINPEIQKLSGKDDRREEGCLSFPGKYLPVVRPNKVKVKFTDASGQKQILKASGLLARAVQHENDHLDGILFTERAEVAG